MEKKKAALLSILSNAVIIVLKIITGIISGSISIISEAIHSSFDILASCMTYFAVSQSGKPADKMHPYGHGKYEDMSGFIEGCLIICAGLYIVYEVIKKVVIGYSVTFEAKICIYVMAFAVIANIIVGNYVLSVAKRTGSIALYADSQHLRADVYSAFGVLCGLLLIKATGIVVLDAVIAFMVAVTILKTGIKLVKKTLNNLLDGSLPAEDITKIQRILDENSAVKGYKNLRARQLGKCKDVEVTLLMQPELSLSECHKVCDDIERAIDCELIQAVTIIHPEPYTENN